TPSSRASGSAGPPAGVDQATIQAPDGAGVPARGATLDDAAPVGPLTLSVISTRPATLHPVTLSGPDEVTTRSLQPIRVIDPGAGPWNRTGQVTDFRAPDDAGVILGDNLGWRPTISILHGDLSGAVTAGPPVAPGDPGLAHLQV